MSSVSEILLNEHRINIRPGAKGECPFCHGKNFSLTPDDTLGKCFSPPCTRFLRVGQENGRYRHSVPRVLDALYHDFHRELLHLPPGQPNAYSYVRDERGIHEQVIADAMLGAVPASYNVSPHFQPILDEAKAALDALKSQQ